MFNHDFKSNSSIKHILNIWALLHKAALAYPDKVVELVEPVKEKALAGEFCDDPSGLKSELDDISKEILSNLDSFTYTLTSDGMDYKSGGHGCSGATRIPNKISGTPCPAKRDHKLKQKATQSVIGKKSSPLKIGE